MSCTVFIQERMDTFTATEARLARYLLRHSGAVLGMTAREFAQAAGIPEHYTDYEAMLTREDIDAVYIASPNRFHLEQAVRAMEHKKHVILEKPAAVRKGDAERLVQTAEKHGVFCFEAISTLFMPNYLALKERLPQLGRVRRVRSGDEQEHL